MFASHRGHAPGTVGCYSKDDHDDANCFGFAPPSRGTPDSSGRKD